MTAETPPATIRTPVSALPWTGDDSGVVHLVYRACLNCGRESFPPQPYGCLECGSHDEDVFVVRRAEAVGTLVTQVQVLVNPGRPTPYRVGEIAVAGTSLCVQALVAGDRLAPGDRVRAAVTADRDVAFAAFAEGLS